MLALCIRTVVLRWRNWLQRRDALRPEIVAAARQKLGHEPSRNDCYLEWCACGAKLRFDAKHPYPQRTLVVGLVSTRWFSVIHRFASML